LCSDDPQLLHNSCRSPSTRSQWPRAGQSGFRHCTVHPGKYCIVLQLKSGPNPLAQHQNPPVRAEPAGKMPGLCGKRPCVSTRIHTISSGAVALKKARAENGLGKRGQSREICNPERSVLELSITGGFPYEPQIPHFIRDDKRDACRVGEMKGRRTISTVSSDRSSGQLSLAAKPGCPAPPVAPASCL